MNEYEKQAQDFLEKYGLRVSSTYLGFEVPKWDDQGHGHAKYRLRISREKREYPRSLSFMWYQSIAHQGDKPTAYNVLTTLSAESYVHEDFEDFYGNFGYDTDSRRAEKIFKPVQKLAKRVNTFFTEEEIEDLREIN